MNFTQYMVVLLRTRGRVIALIYGLLAVLLWTVYRHISNGINYDVVGQIGITQQWLHGQHSGSIIGTTSYLLKMPLYLVVNCLPFITPMNRLLLLALICNVLTFGFIFVISEKILDIYNRSDKSWLYLGLSWLASIFGFIFWADYANSRNLEVAGGVLFVYLVLKSLQSPSRRLWLATLLCGSIVFFADPLQFYSCGVGMCLFMVGRLAVTGTKAQSIQSLYVISLILVCLLCSQALFYVSKHALPIEFLHAAQQRSVDNTDGIVPVLQQIASNSFKLFGADVWSKPYGIESLQRAGNFLVLCTLIGLLFTRKWSPRARQLCLFFAAIIVANYLSYLVSGQALHWATERYLIMVPVCFVLIAGSGTTGHHRYVRIGQFVIAGVIIINSLLLTGALIKQWPTRHSKDGHISSLIYFLRQGQYRYALSSRELGITATYFSQGDVSVLPMACDDGHKLLPTNLFYDQAAFTDYKAYHGKVAIIVPPGGIKYLTNCTDHDIQSQFGTAIKTASIPDVGTALIYNSQQVPLKPIQ